MMPAPDRDLLDFLVRVSTGDRPPITPGTAALAFAAWRQVATASGDAIPVPAACTGPDGEMFLAWNAGRHHLELEIVPGGPAEFFYRDRETGDYLGEDHEPGAPIPAAILPRLSYFCDRGTGGDIGTG